MPAILAHPGQDAWVSGTAEEAWAVLKPYPSDSMVAWRVNGPVDPTSPFLAE